MAPKKTKSGSSGKKKATPQKGRKNSNNNKQSAKTEFDDKLQQQSQLNPQERVAFVQPLWETLSDEERIALLTVRVDDVVARLKQQTENAKQNEGSEVEALLDTIYDRGLDRLNAQGSWKVWQWSADDPPFTCAETFKKEALETRLPEELRDLLPREEGKPTEKPAEAALRERMTSLINNIHSQLQSAQEAWRRGQRAVQESGEQTRDANIDLVISILDTLKHEHHCLYHTILIPVAEFICAMVPAKNRKSTKTELFFEDFEKITPEDVAKLYEWLTEKVDALCSKLKPDPKDEDVDEDEEAVGDIDLFSLTDDKSAFAVNAKWMEHLQERKLSEEGQPRKVKKGEDEHRVGLVLEWVYGSIVSTAEKARDGAKRPLGVWRPSVNQAYQNLVEMLKDHTEWTTRLKSAKTMLKDMLSIRKKMTSLMKQHNVDSVTGKDAPEDMPDALIEGVLFRESILTQSKLHILKYERLMASNQLKTLRTELRQNEPEFERLKRELENAKMLVRQADGTRGRSSKANDALLEDQLEVQSAFREQGTRLQAMYDKRQRTELEVARREQEIGQLENWYKNVTQLLTKHRNASAGETPDEVTLTKVRTSFHKDFKKQLYSDTDDQTFFARIKAEMKTVEKRVEDGAVVLQHLEMSLINVACDDPGAVIGTTTILSLLQERLDKKAMEFSTQKAAEAMDALLKMEEEKMQNKAKKELKRKAKNTASQPELPPTIEPIQDDSAEETTEKTEIVDEEPIKPIPQEPISLGSNSVEDPFLVEQSIEYEASLLAEAEAAEFQCVSNRRRGVRKKLQQTSGQGRQRHAGFRSKGDGNTRQTSGPKQSNVNKTSAAKTFANRSKSVRNVVESRTAQPEQKSPSENALRKSVSVPNPQSTAIVDTQQADSKRSAWVKGAIPHAVTNSASRPRLPSSEDVTQSTLVKKRTESESSVNIPSTPEALDVDSTLVTATSDPLPKELATNSSTLPVDTPQPEIPSDNEAEESETFKGDGDQFFHMVQAMNTQPIDAEVMSEDGGIDAESRHSDRSSDATSPEPEHVMIGPPLMPPPIGIPPPIGAMTPYHPGFYDMHSAMATGMHYPLPYMPDMPTSTAQVHSPTDESETLPVSSPHPYPQFYQPHVLSHAGPHLPMPFPIMPYGQWFPPGMPSMGEYENQVRKFTLRPTAEEFIPPSLRHDETVSVIDEEEGRTSTESNNEHNDSIDENKHDYSNVDLPEVNDSTVAVTQTIEQTC